VVFTQEEEKKWAPSPSWEDKRLPEGWQDQACPLSFLHWLQGGRDPCRAWSRPKQTRKKLVFFFNTSKSYQKTVYGVVAVWN